MRVLAHIEKLDDCFGQFWCASSATAVRAARFRRRLKFFLLVDQESCLPVGRRGATLRAMNSTRKQLMRTTNFVALAGGLLLTAATFLGIYYDARHGVALHRSEVTTALPAHR